MTAFCVYAKKIKTSVFVMLNIDLGQPFPKEIHVRKHLLETAGNHRVEGVGRDLCGSSSPTPL